MTAWILSFGPSDRYDSAQHASARMSVSLTNTSQDSTLRHGDTCRGENSERRGSREPLSINCDDLEDRLEAEYKTLCVLTTEKCAIARALYLSWQETFVKSGGGFFPLHRFDSAHTAFLIIVRRFCLANSLQKKFQSYVSPEIKDQIFQFP